MSRVLVVGAGVTGAAVARVLSADGFEVVVADDHVAEGSAGEAAGGRRAGGTAGAVGTGELASLASEADLVVVSPGLPASHPVHAAARAAGVEVVSEVELAWRRLAASGERAPRLVAVTGTNGKTTVATVVAAAMSNAGIAAVAAGNIGLPLIAAVEDMTAGAGTAGGVIVAEVSSFQLAFTYRFHPSVATWLNFSPDHLDWHPSLEHYRESKARIWSNLGPGDLAVANADDDTVAGAAERVASRASLQRWSTCVDADWCERDGRLIGPGGWEVIRADELARSMPHDRANALAAAATATGAGAPAGALRDALASVGPPPHRVELVAESGGVSWFDDSKATTPASVLAAMSGFTSVVLIAGGRNKGLELGVLSSVVPPVRAVVAIGEAAPAVAEAFAGMIPVTEAGSMADAVGSAAEMALPGDSVVLSPGCTSFDWYSSYAERGEDFAHHVRTMVRASRQRRHPC